MTTATSGLAWILRHFRDDLDVSKMISAWSVAATPSRRDTDERGLWLAARPGGRDHCQPSLPDEADQICSIHDAILPLVLM